MRRTVIGAGLVLLAGVVAADAQGIGYGPGVNPSNPQDLRYRSNPQDLLAPGGSNRQDLVRRPPDVNVGRSKVTSVPTSYTVKTKPKQKPHHRKAGGSGPTVSSDFDTSQRSRSAVQGVPTIDITPSCRAAAKGSAGMTQDYESCHKSELATREISGTAVEQLPGRRPRQLPPADDHRHARHLYRIPDLPRNEA